MAHLSGVSRRPASLPRVQESSGTVSRGAGAEVTGRVQESDPATRGSASQVISPSPGYPTRYLGVEHDLYKILGWPIKRARTRDLD
jgi:hypothetical protein